MKSLFLSSIALLVLVSAVCSESLIFRLGKWQRSDGKTLWCFSDAHPEGGCVDPVQDITQRHQIVEEALSLDAFVICEDMANCVSKNRLFSRLLQKTSNDKLGDDTCITFLTSACNQAGVRCWNAEFRQLKTPSVCGVANISARDVVQRIDSVVTSLSSYKREDNVNPATKEYIDQAMNDFFKNAFIVKKLRNLKDEPIQILLAAFDDEEQADSLENSIHLCDLRLLDAYVVKRLGALYEKEENIFLCLGSGHIKNIESLLPKLGYVLVEPHSVNKEPDIVFSDKGIQISSSSAIDIKKYFQRYGRSNTAYKKLKMESASASSSSLAGASQQKSLKESAAITSHGAGASAAALYAPAQPGTALASSSSSPSVAKLSAAQQKTVKIDDQDLDAVLALRLLKEDSESASASASVPLPTKKGVKRKK